MPEIRLVQTSCNDAGFGGGGEAANTVPAPVIVVVVFDASACSRAGRPGSRSVDA